AWRPTQVGASADDRQQRTEDEQTGRTDLILPSRAARIHHPAKSKPSSTFTVPTRERQRPRPSIGPEGSGGMSGTRDTTSSTQWLVTSAPSTNAQRPSRRQSHQVNDTVTPQNRAATRECV